MRFRVTLVLAVMAALLFPSTPAQALTPDRWGFAYVDKPWEPSWYDLLPTRQAGKWPAGQSAQGRKTGPGRFLVRFPSIGSGSRGIPHVTAVGPDGHGTSNYCQLIKWFQDGADQMVEVKCQRPSGDFPDDTRFTVMWTISSGVEPATRTHAYIHYNGGTQVYNSTNNAVSLAGSNPYHVTFNGVGDVQQLAGNIQVTAVHLEGVPRRCKVSSWGGTLNVSAYITCYDALGNIPPMSHFVASYNKQRSIYGDVPRHFGYLWCVNGAPAAPLLTNFNSTAPPNNQCPPKPGGGYQTVFPDLGADPRETHTQVTAQGGGSAYCNITQLWPIAPDGTPQVDCYTNSGGRTNHNFLIAFTARA
jgi:hypothetical protein